MGRRRRAEWYVTGPGIAPAHWNTSTTVFTAPADPAAGRIGIADRQSGGPGRTISIKVGCGSITDLPATGSMERLFRNLYNFPHNFFTS
jgi:hypothetical protein